MVLVLLEHLGHLDEYPTAEPHPDKDLHIVGCHPVMPGEQLGIGVSKMIQRLGQEDDRHLPPRLVRALDDRRVIGAFSRNTPEVGG